MKTIFKKYFVAGALVLVPIILTIWILKSMILWCDRFFSALIPSSVLYIPGLGLIFTVSLILLTGVLTRLYLGRKLIAWGDQLIQKIPFGRSIYGAIKQFLNAVVSTGPSSFSQVVLVEYPRKGSYMIGFVTGDTSAILQKNFEQKMINIFVPTSPNPTSGFLIIAPKENVTPIDMTPEQAFKLIISGGAVSS